MFLDCQNNAFGLSEKFFQLVALFGTVDVIEWKGLIHVMIT